MLRQSSCPPPLPSSSGCFLIYENGQEGLKSAISNLPCLAHLDISHRVIIYAQGTKSIIILLNHFLTQHMLPRVSSSQARRPRVRHQQPALPGAPGHLAQSHHTTHTGHRPRGLCSTHPTPWPARVPTSDAACGRVSHTCSLYGECAWM